ncbi:MAG: sarcosine oxidase subunit delta, partial [Aestuariivirgaceae bacterium]
MIRIPCPHCGLRDEIEFTYRGDTNAVRPAPDAPVDAFHD